MWAYQPVLDPPQLRPTEPRLHQYRYVPRGAPFDARKSLKSAHTSSVHAVPLTHQYAYQPIQYHWVQAAPATAAAPRYVIAQPQPTVGYRYVAPNVIAAPTVAAASPHYHEHYPASHNHSAYGYNHTYYGRTQEEVDQQNRIVAEKSGAYDQHEMVPKDPKSDQMFWCREKDGSWTLRSFWTIQNDMKPGRWKMDAGRGSLIFWRE